MDHRFLNKEVPEFFTRFRPPKISPSPSGSAWNQTATSPRLHRVRVYETPDLFVDFYGEAVMPRRSSHPPLHLLVLASPAQRRACPTRRTTPPTASATTRTDTATTTRSKSPSAAPSTRDTGMVCNLVDLDDFRRQGSALPLPSGEFEYAARIRRTRAHDGKSLRSRSLKFCSAVSAPRIWKG